MLQPIDSQRYLRQMTLSGFGEAGQAALQAARVLLIGVGGLGCPAALYLAAAGVGTIGLMDGDAVSLLNLHRQILYTDSEIGMPKVTCAANALHRCNSSVTIQTYPVWMILNHLVSIMMNFRSWKISGLSDMPEVMAVHPVYSMALKKCRTLK